MTKQIMNVTQTHWRKVFDNTSRSHCRGDSPNIAPMFVHMNVGLKGGVATVAPNYRRRYGKTAFLSDLSEMWTDRGKAKWYEDQSGDPPFLGTLNDDFAVYFRSEFVEEKK